MYLRPYLSEPRRQLILVLSIEKCGMSSRNELLYILSVASLLVPRFLPIMWACYRCMSILQVKSTQETIIPVVVPFDRIWGMLWSCSSAK